MPRMPPRDCDFVGKRNAVIAGEALQRADRNRLQIDAAGPRVAHPAEHRPVCLGVGPAAVEMGADRGGAVCKSATKAKIETRFDIVLGVVLATVGDDRVPGY
jgi:hypothetical protein